MATSNISVSYHDPSALGLSSRQWAENFDVALQYEGCQYSNIGELDAGDVDSFCGSFASKLAGIHQSGSQAHPPTGMATMQPSVALLMYLPVGQYSILQSRAFKVVSV